MRKTIQQKWTSTTKSASILYNIFIQAHFACNNINQYVLCGRQGEAIAYLYRCIATISRCIERVSLFWFNRASVKYRQVYHTFSYIEPAQEGDETIQKDTVDNKTKGAIIGVVTYEDDSSLKV